MNGGQRDITGVTAGASVAPVEQPGARGYDLRSMRIAALLRGGPVIALLLLSIYLAFATPHFLTAGNLMNVARQVSINAILAIGQTMVIISGGIDLSVGAILAVSASFGAVAMTYWGLTMWAGIILALLVGALAGFVNGVVVTKGRIPDFIATLGMLSTARGVALIVTGGLPVPSHLTAVTLKAYLPEGLIWIGSGDIFGIPTAALIALAIAAIGWFITTHTVLGR
ncbi:MAG TPA: ABC transporter permease, partial [Firmicutes bacterium]|nr:ABC transporter permease [Bacillota bacterium]